MLTEAQWRVWPQYDIQFRTAIRIGIALDAPPYGARKRLLFGVECVRRAWGLLTDPRSRAAVETAERYAHAEASSDDVALAKAGAREAANALYVGTRNRGPGHTPYSQEPQGSGWWAASAPYLVAGWRGGDPFLAAPFRARQALDLAGVSPIVEESAHQSALARDIFGNPFRPVTFDPHWRTDTALSLARVMYETRDFAAMPILADALQEAGCEDADILTHCRDDGVHARGCWVVDQVLGKA